MLPSSSSTPYIRYFAVLVIALLFIGAAYWFGVHNRDTVTPEPTPTASLLPATPTPTSSSSPVPTTSFKNQYLELNIPIDWEITPVANAPWAVNITSGSYILYINTQANQASGVQGGRFAEIGQGAPSADTVLKSWPSNPCETASVSPVPEKKFYSQRNDLYVSAGTSETCNTPSSGTAWYFSYLTNNSNRYFNYYVADQNPALVVTMSYQTTDVNQLPKKDDPALINALNQMTAIADSLVIIGR